jgi:cyclin-dependent kinase 2
MKKFRIVVQEPNLIRDRYGYLEKIGQGGYGTVYRAIDKAKRRKVAMKKVVLEEDDGGIPGTSLREISILKNLKHQNIVKLYDLFVQNNRLFLVMEYCDMDFQEFMRIDIHFRKNMEKIKYYLTQILSGISHCHHRRIVHRDLKPQNLLVDQRKNLVKVADFGLARLVSIPNKLMSPEVVTLYYRAPEILLNAHYYGTPVDIWSIGCIFAEMVTGAPFFNGNTQIDMLEHIFQIMGTPNNITWPGLDAIEGFSETFPRWRSISLGEYFPNLTSNGLIVLKNMLMVCPIQRTTARMILQEPFFCDVIDQVNVC